MFGEIINSGSRSSSKVQSTLRWKAMDSCNVKMQNLKKNKKKTKTKKTGEKETKRMFPQQGIEPESPG